tara:strand:+ start:401 stop:1090 length:690 start_codon:yes stop_codon:yes gene_type:complete
MKKIFLDCGTHLGEGFEHFRKEYAFDETWDIHLFEPNPNLKDYITENVVEKYPNLNILFHPVAVAATNTPRQAEFRLQVLGEDPHGVHPAGSTGGGSSLVGQEHFRPEEIIGYETVNVETVPMTTILQNLVEEAYKDDPSICSVTEDENNVRTITLLRDKCQIIVKLDVEGLEYQILPELVNTGYGSWLSHIAVEFHKRRFKSEQKLRDLEVSCVGELFQMGVVCFPHW